jgi:thiol-disulfide isomerase/thioredoxin
LKIRKNWTEEKGLILTIIVLSVVVIALFIYVYVPKLTGYALKSTGAEQYSVEVIEITGDCEDCFDTSALIDALLKENNIKIKSMETLNYDSKEAEEIINKYNIKTIPALVVLSRNIEKIGIDDQVFSIEDDYALFDKSVPYIDLETNEVKGLVQLKEIQSDNCMECISLSQLETQFESLGVKIKDYEIIGSASDRGKELIEKNNLEFTSSLLISKDIEEYWWIFDQIKDSLIEKEDNYVFKTPIAPYVDLADGKIKGKVDIILIKNKSCEDCFDVDELKGSFLGLGIYFDNEKSVDISSSEGQNLLTKYNITAIPTIILSKEIQDYDSIKKMLEQIGTFEDDDKFVFRRLDSLNVKYQEIHI